MMDEMRSKVAAAALIAEKLSSAVKEAVDLILAAGAIDLTTKQIELNLKSLRKSLIFAWSKNIGKIDAALKNIAEEARSKRQDKEKSKDSVALSAPAPSCPLCEAGGFKQMRDLVDHLTVKHGWLSYYGCEGCGCGVGKSWDYDRRKALLARHLLDAGDLEIHLAKANLKKAAEQHDDE